MERQLTSLCPELEVFYTHRGELVGVVGVPADVKDLVLASPGDRQLLSLLPVPHHDAVIVVQAH